MASKRAVGLMVALFATSMVGCASNSDTGTMERMGANAGRVIDDSAITAKVKSALIADSTTKAYQINVETFEGKVQLSGYVDDAEARRRAEQVAGNVEGVRDVDNKLELRDRG
jgi:hyperosmotically inducible protein